MRAGRGGDHRPRRGHELRHEGGVRGGHAGPRRQAAVRGARAYCDPAGAELVRQLERPAIRRPCGQRDYIARLGSNQSCLEIPAEGDRDGLPRSRHIGRVDIHARQRWFRRRHDGRNDQTGERKNESSYSEHVRILPRTRRAARLAKRGARGEPFESHSRNRARPPGRIRPRCVSRLLNFAEHDDRDHARRGTECGRGGIFQRSDGSAIADLVDCLVVLAHRAAPSGTAHGIRAILKMLLAVIVSLKC